LANLRYYCRLDAQIKVACLSNDWLDEQLKRFALFDPTRGGS
jgi:hypothetical protein